MNSFTVIFLDKEYSIPCDVMVYVDLIGLVNEIRDSLISSFCHQLVADVCSLEQSDFMVEEINKQVSKFIALLLENDIYDKTINDFLCDSKGYELFRSKIINIIHQIARIRQNKLDFYKAGVQEALYKKETSVTGLGFGIVSNSFIDHMVYAHMNSSELEKQERAAIKTYNNEIAELEDAAKSYDEQENIYISKNVIPTINAVLTYFSYELLDKYISDLIIAGKFNKSALSYTNIVRSNDLLKNLEHTTNKHAVIESAFAVCPYNINVYMHAMEYDILDYPSFQTAKFFGHEETLLAYLKEEMNNSTAHELHFNLSKLKQYALYTDTSLKEVTAYAADFVINSYSEIIALIEKSHRCKTFFSQVSEEEIIKDDSISKKKSNLIVDSVSFINLWDNLIHNCGHNDLLNRLLGLIPEQSNLYSKEEVDSYLKTRLYNVLEELRTNLASEIAEKEAARLAYERMPKTRMKKFWHENKATIIVYCIILGLIVWLCLINVPETIDSDNGYSHQIDYFESMCYRCDEVKATHRIHSSYEDIYFCADCWREFGEQLFWEYINGK